jgi:hypothetical protein
MPRPARRRSIARHEVALIQQRVLGRLPPASRGA